MSLFCFIFFMEGDLEWEEKFVEKNKEVMKQTIRLFVSKRGVILFFISLNVELLLFHFFAVSRVTSAVMFVSIQYVYATLFFILPELVFNIFYPESLADVSHEVLLQHAAAFHRAVNVLGNMNRSFFVNWDVFSVSCVFLAMSGVLLLMRALPIYFLGYFFVMISLLAMSYAIQRNNKPRA